MAIGDAGAQELHHEARTPLNAGTMRTDDALSNNTRLADQPRDGRTRGDDPRCFPDMTNHQFARNEGQKAMRTGVSFKKGGYIDKALRTSKESATTMSR